MSDDPLRKTGNPAGGFVRWGNARSICLLAIWAVILAVPLLSLPFQAAAALAAFAIAGLGWRVRDRHVTLLALFWAVFI